MAPITHLVLLQFKEDVSPDVVNEVCQFSANAGSRRYTHHFISKQQAASRLLGLREQCIHPTSSKPYIVSVKGGRDNSSEGFQV